MKIKRVIAAIPVQSAEAAWVQFCDLVTDDDSSDANQLNAISSVMQSLIADEQFTEAPIVMAGVGHRLVVYFCFGEEALEQGTEVDALTWNPTAGDWSMYVPCDETNMAWAPELIEERSNRVSAHPVDEKPDIESSDANAGEIEVDWGALGS
ncbi:MAG: hypothetical protein JJ934_03290 [Pseudomonadales bacterium]|nr:hypothetical protein [Pseudomonadales bacterium]